MSHPIEQRIRVLRARVRRLVAVYGLSWVVAVVVGAVIVLGLADYLIRFQDPGLRVICSMLVVGVLGWTGYRYLCLPLLARLSEVDLALRLERRFPSLADRLVSSVEFLRQPEDDPMAGSAALRRAVISETTSETERLDFGEVLDPRPAFRAAVVTVSICLLAGVLVALAPEASATAVARLVNPFGVPWPQRTHLEVRPVVSRVAKGRPVEIRVIDAEGAKLPRTVRIHYLFEGADETVTEDTQVMHPVGEAVVARLEPVRRFSYRAEGGDDDSMPWHPVEVVDPPGLEPTVVKLIPPAYTGWPPEIVQGKAIRALVGTRVQISGKTTRPLDSAVFWLADGRQIDAGPTGQQRLEVAAEFVMEKVDQAEEPGSVRFTLVDQEGLRGEVGWEIRTVADEPPLVTIKQPSDTVFATPQAVVPLQVVAKDDLAIHEVALVFRPSDQSSGEDQPGESQRKEGQPAEGQPEAEEAVLPLYAGPEAVGPQPAGGLFHGAEPGDRREIEHRWELAELRLKPGTELTFHVTAADYSPQTGQSQPRRLIVITPEQLQQRIADRQSVILAELGRVLKMQQGSRQQVKSLEIRLAEIGQLEQLDVDRLQGAELNQREVGTSLTSESAGVPMHVSALLADLDNNKLDSPDLRRRMQALLSEIGRLDREHLALIGRELTAAIKSAQLQLQGQAAGPGARGQGPEAGGRGLGASPNYEARITNDETAARYPLSTIHYPLSAAGEHQDQVIASLERLLDQLAEWDKYRRFHREISQLLREQEELTKRSSEVGRRTLGKEPKDLLPQETADLKIVGGQQLDLARQLDRSQQRMDEAAVELRENDPLAAETVADALAEARRLAISGQMRSAGGQLEGNQIGQATGRQRQIAQDLQEVLDILANRRGDELARLVEKLGEAEKELAEIERRQAELSKRLDENSQDADQARRRGELQRLGQQQTELQQEAERLARRLERLLAEQAGQTTRQAAGHMGEAGQCAGQGNCQGASRAAEAAEEALREARRQLAARRLQAEAELAAEELGRLEESLKHLRGRQEGILAETQRLGQLQEQGELTRAQAANLGGLAREQGLLQAETGQLGDKLGGAGAFQLTLSRAAGSMGQAAALLSHYQVGAPAQEAEKEALGRLDLLLQALKKEPASEAGSGGAGGTGGAGGGAGQGGNPAAFQILAELKLLRLLQEELNLRTAELQKALKTPDALTAEQRRQYAALSEEQGRLADLTAQLLQVEQEAAEEDPAGSPDVRPDPGDDERGPLPKEEGTP